jgi:hypothetical protein
MSYAYEYTEGLKQFGMVHLILKLTDSDNILPEVNIPVVLDDSEYHEENLARIANQLIQSNTPVIEEVTINSNPEPQQILDETIINSDQSSNINPITV